LICIFYVFDYDISNVQIAASPPSGSVRPSAETSPSVKKIGFHH
jgi:hypothetical protein